MPTTTGSVVVMNQKNATICTTAIEVGSVARDQKIRNIRQMAAALSQMVVGGTAIQVMETTATRQMLRIMDQ